MAYGQWVSFNIKLKGFSGTIGDAKLKWGKFYKYDNKDKELEVYEINAITLEDGKLNNNVISACGRSDAGSGTEGYFWIYRGEEAVCQVYWDCPWGSKINAWSVSKYDDDKYNPSISGGSKNGGAIGTLTLTIWG